MGLVSGAALSVFLLFYLDFNVVTFASTFDVAALSNYVLTVWTLLFNFCSQLIKKSFDTAVDFLDITWVDSKS